MDGSNPKIVLLDESTRLSNLLSFKTSTSEVRLSDWTVDELPNTAVHLNSNEQFNINNNRKKMSSVIDRGSLRRRFSPKCNSRCKKFDVKFEHFTNSCEFIEQYRNAKIAQLERAFEKLLEDNCARKTNDSSCMKEKIMNRNRPCSVDTSSSGTMIDETNTSTGDDMVTPSLPKTGYFTGKKWVCPKPVYLQPHRPHSDAKRPIGPGRLSSKKSNLERKKAYDPKMLCLRGTGKPINSNNVKTWASPRKVACRSAPSSQQRMWTNLLSPKIKPSMNNQSASRVQRYQGYCKYPDVSNTGEATITNDTFMHLSRVERRTSDHGQVTRCENTEYENMFHNVIQYYKQPKEQSRSHVCVRIGT